MGFGIWVGLGFGIGMGFWQMGWDMGWDGIGDSPIPFNMGGKYNGTCLRILSLICSKEILLYAKSLFVLCWIHLPAPLLLVELLE
ncbi:unnamed protein product [Rhizophagus irregularis]|nr:unnamed protein product [Rhizophagus irregularis]